MADKRDITEKIRLFMKEEKIDFLPIFSTDEYLNEYVSLNENARYILTGFSGSTGDALITSEDIFLFVDGRYHLQADEETDKNFVTVVKVGMDRSPQAALFEKIAELSDTAATVGIISKKINYTGFKKLFDLLAEKNVSYKELDYDPVIKIAEITNPEKAANLRFIPVEITGVSAEKKLDLIIENNKKNNIDVLIITKLEEIAYLTNLRGNEIAYSSTFKAKAVINSDKCIIYTDLNKINSKIKEKLNDKFVFKDENNDFTKDLENLSQSINIGYDSDSMNLSDYRKLEKLKHKPIEVKESYIASMKSIKNKYELEHMQECFLRTDKVVTQAISWLNQGIENGEKISEKDFSDKVKNLFYENGAVGLSFQTITASGANTAFIHYTKADPEKFIKPDDLVLLDCGAYFEGGYATDITRTFLACPKKASANSNQKEIYTKVLKAFLNGINYNLEIDTTGFDIDKKVREIINKDKPEGFNFAHGTGHGVGIPVHESPPRLGPSEVSRVKLQPGMVFTIEPGLYCNEWGGVRIENTVTISENKIKSLTKAKLDDSLIDKDLLSEEENAWLEDYQKHAIR